MKWGKVILWVMVVAVCGLSLASGAFAALSANRGLYAIDEVSDNFYKIDTATGAATLVGSLVENVSLGGLAYDTSTGTMYVSDVTLGGGQWGLGSIDLTTGAVTVIGDHVNSSDIHGLAYDSRNDVLYGSDVVSDGLASINRSTGESTAIGSYVNAVSDIQGLAYCPANDTLYGIDGTNIYTINRTTGEATVLGAHGLTPGIYIGLDYDENSGQLYASSGSATDLYQIDMTAGTAFPVGATGIQVTGLASVPAQGALSVLYINTQISDSDFVTGLETLDIDGFSVVKAFNITPLTTYMENFDVVLVASNLSFADPVQLGDNLADYVDAGGGLGLFIGTLITPGGYGLGGRIVGPDYLPIVQEDYSNTASTATTIESHDITDGVTVLATTVLVHVTTLQGGGHSLGTYDTGYLLGAYADSVPVAAINVYPEDTYWSGDLIQMVENLINWGASYGSSSGGGSGGGGGGGGGGCFIQSLMD